MIKCIYQKCRFEHMLYKTPLKFLYVSFNYRYLVEIFKLNYFISEIKSCKHFKFIFLCP